MIVSGQERRESYRVPYLCEVECRDFGPGQLRISDLSKTGAFIDTMNAVRVGSIVQLRFKIKGYEIAVTAEVRHCVPRIGIGVRFLDLNADHQDCIDLILAEKQDQRAA